MAYKFIIEGTELEKAKIWIDKHECKFRNKYTGSIGGTTTYQFTPTSIGTVIVVKCACHQECDVTEYGEW